MKPFFQKIICVLGFVVALTATPATAQNYFRSIATGNWSTLTTWEMSPDNITWGPAGYAPSNTDNAITIQSPNVVTVTGAANVTIDEVVVNTGATLVNAITGAGQLYYNDGIGIDLAIYGTFIESQVNSINWTASATWIMGSNGTLIRACSNAVSSNFWQQRYSGGIATIPATSTWIVRKTATQTPAISTTVGGVGAWYPNLIIENSVAGNWMTAGSSYFQGAAAFPTIKGNWDIGGTGIGTVDFWNDVKNATPTRVLGNLIIRTGNTIRNFGTGIEVSGNVTINGTLSYDAADLRTLDFAGGNAQTFSGTGTVGIWNMRMLKTAGDLILNRAIKVDNALTLNAIIPGGRIFSTATYLITIEDNATALGATNSSHVDGPVRKLGDEAFNFPVGKNGYYRSIAMGIATGAVGGTFWTETFSNGCVAGCFASGYSGPNGAWTVTAPTANGPAPNQWFVSCAENGNAAGVCGAGCGSDPSLHVGANPASECTCLICSATNGDCGAAYDATSPGDCIGFCSPSGNSVTDKRAESPTINCTGQTGITLAFNYIEGGEASSDNATLWYYDGASWAQIADMAKTAVCGGGQGMWTAYGIALPVSANNNANVKIAFRWANNSNSVGTDPSFAVDDITLGTAPVGADSYTGEYFRANPQVAYNNTLNAPLNHISQCEYWTLDRSNGVQARTVTLSWDTQNSCGVTNLTDLRVAYFNSASWDDKGNGGTTGSTAAGTIVTATAVNNFGPFTLASVTTTNPLPVYLVDFSATPQGNDVLLNWVTSSEINNDRFEILSATSAEGISNFEKIDQVAGVGNSTSIHHYSYLDQRPGKKGTYYYRLRQVDYDGRNMLTNIVAVNFKSGKAMNLVGVIPNPYTDRTSVQVYISEKGMLAEKIMDVFGREISTKTFSLDKGMFSFDPEENTSLSSGVYFVELIFNDERIVSRLVKE
ncbi:MAG: T9SS type A sorting domain-containing protein [Bacteroidota bacterium]